VATEREFGALLSFKAKAFLNPTSASSNIP